MIAIFPANKNLVKSSDFFESFCCNKLEFSCRRTDSDTVKKRVKIIQCSINNPIRCRLKSWKHFHKNRECNDLFITFEFLEYLFKK